MNSHYRAAVLLIVVFIALVILFGCANRDKPMDDPTGAGVAGWMKREGL